ncbi:hypothetical protein ACRWY5_23760 [Escherichia coli]
MSDKVCSDMGIFNGSFVDHSWICLLDRASGYVDKSFQKDSAHNRFMKGLQGVPAHCNYRYIGFLAGSRASPGHRSAASTVFLIAIPEQKSDSLSAGNTL